MLSSMDTALPGKWDTSFAEFQRGIMDAVTDPTVETIVFMKGAQIGWTAMLGNIIGYYAHQDPSSMLMIQPTVEMAEAWSRERFAPMIEETPAIRDLFSDPKSRDANNTLRMKQFPGGYIAIVGANAPAGLASRPIRIVLADEIDRWPASAGTEGDPLRLASMRQTTFWNRKTLIGSTPTNKGFSAIEREYLNSDQRRYFVPCFSCKKDQFLSWSQVKWDKKVVPTKKHEHLPKTARYQCEHCGILWDDEERNAAVKLGHWKATKPFDGVAGFHLSQLYSPWVPLARVVKSFLESKSDPQLLKVWTNTVLAETFEEKGERADSDTLKDHIESYGPNDLPDGVYFATMGVDVQKDRLEAEIVGWGVGEESWGISYEVINGDPALKSTWDELDEVRKRKHWTVDGRLVRVRATCIDTGGHHAQEVIAYCQSKPSTENVYPIKGQSGSRPIWPKHHSKTKQNQIIWMVGVDTAKDTIYARYGLRIKEGQSSLPGYNHFPESYGDDWFAQATAERVITKYKEGRPSRVWVLEGGKRNEALDCRVYAYAAVKSLRPEQTGPSKVKIDPAEHEKFHASNIDTRMEELPQLMVPKTRRVRRMRSQGI